MNALYLQHTSTTEPAQVTSTPADTAESSKAYFFVGRQLSTIITFENTNLG